MARKRGYEGGHGNKQNKKRKPDTSKPADELIADLDKLYRRPAPEVAQRTARLPRSQLPIEEWGLFVDKETPAFGKCAHRLRWERKPEAFVCQ
ncbi:uncharacterized protein J4E88_002416 [Alternaria novae-zelandiae]|uniref:uncharacterized protein n=1 Tax=Alternaria novae-zelandiae TaxID=430562 RepID=UPI0020C28642|nr:uncharacterized protein J4E88_002416 [Alternaria novae-zelandiae]KAI4690943.1 hypothetical protein J4E88_002416 [Alternaria novae-zelandiae]